MPTIDQLFIDVGASNRAACPVKVGDVAAFDRPFLDLGDRLVSKAMDDRIAVAVMIEALKELKSTPHEIYFVFSTQEEVGLRGATAAGYGVDPDLALAVDVTRTGDTPKGVKMEVASAKAPPSRSATAACWPTRASCAGWSPPPKKLGMPYQMEVLEGGTTDARAIQLSRAGVPAGCLSIPTRYIHSPSEMVDFRDVQQCVQLLTALVSEPIKLE